MPRPLPALPTAKHPWMTKDENLTEKDAETAEVLDFSAPSPFGAHDRCSPR